MSLYEKFGTYNFAPREGAIQMASDILSRILDRAPSDADYSASIDRIGDDFVFEITLRSLQEIFHCQRKVPVKNLVGAPRTWQVSIVEKMEEDLEDQLLAWRKKRFENESESPA